MNQKFTKSLFGVSTLILAFALTPGQFFAQSGNAQIVTIISEINDTIFAHTNFKGELKSFKALPVKKTKNDKSHVFYPRDVKSFTITNNEETTFFKTLIAAIDYSSELTAELSRSPMDSLIQDTVFARLLFKGEKSFYLYEDDRVHRTHFLIETTDGNAVELVNKPYKVDNTMMGYNQSYKKQLLQLLASPGITASRILNTPHKKEALIKLLKEYNAAVSAVPPAYEYKKVKPVFQFGLLLGGNVTRLQFYGKSPLLNQLTFDLSTGINAGLLMNMVIPYTRKKWSFCSNLLYSDYHVNSKNVVYDYYVNNDWYKALKEVNIQASSLKLYTAIRYQVPAKLFPFVQLGIANGYTFRHKAEAIYETSFFSPPLTEKTALMSFRKLEQSLFAGLGVQYRAVGAEFRYEIGDGLAKKNYKAGCKMSYTYVLLNFVF